MAWRIDASVICGELDNRERDRVTGRVWLLGRPEPLVLELEGNGHRDLAGRRLEFTNPRPVPADLGGLATEQRGLAGDLTASRKVRVPDVPAAEWRQCVAEGRPFPAHWANSLYLEWFSERNGRVVIESADYVLKLVGATTWEATPAEEAEQRRRSAAAMRTFMQRAVEALERSRRRQPAPGESEEADAHDRP